MILVLGRQRDAGVGLWLQSLFWAAGQQVTLSTCVWYSTTGVSVTLSEWVSSGREMRQSDRPIVSQFHSYLYSIWVMTNEWALNIVYWFLWHEWVTHLQPLLTLLRPSLVDVSFLVDQYEQVHYHGGSFLGMYGEKLLPHWSEQQPVA